MHFAHRTKEISPKRKTQEREEAVCHLDEEDSWGLMLALRSLLTGAGSRVGRPVADVVVVQVEDTRLSSPGGKLLRKRCGESRAFSCCRLQTLHTAQINPCLHSV